VYKKAWSDTKIFKLIKEESGKHFDPKLVELFFENIEAIKDVREALEDKYVAHKEKDQEKQIQILGAYGTKSKGYGTSSFFLNDKNVIDAGHLLEALDVKTVEIENIWMTHSHLDHIVDIAYILDNYFSMRKKPLNIIGLPETIRVIKENFLNDSIWPDFSKIPLTISGEMAVTYTEIEIGNEYEIGKRESIRAFKTDHTVPSCGYVYTKDGTAVLITADTYSLESVYSEIAKDEAIKSLVIECSFPNELDDLALNSKHLTPKLLFEKLKRLENSNLSLYVHHIKPAYFKKVCDQIEQNRGVWDAKILKDGFFINF
jgi:cAMP phosphodiesterase